MDPTTTSNPTPPQRPRHLQRNNISFSDEPPIANLGPITKKAKWTAENEAQLAYAQEELDKSQKRWSRGQEEWILEVCVDFTSAALHDWDSFGLSLFGWGRARWKGKADLLWLDFW